MTAPTVTVTLAGSMPGENGSATSQVSVTSSETMVAAVAMTGVYTLIAAMVAAGYAPDLATTAVLEAADDFRPSEP